MITEDYVSFEVAKLLKEKGFDEACRAVYEEEVLRINGLCTYYNSNLPYYVCAPTIQMAMKWLREVHNIHIDICSTWDVAHWLYQVFVITPITAHNSYVDKLLYTSYEQAVEAGIKYCLEKLF